MLRAMDAHVEEMYTESGRPSIPPERLMPSKVLRALYVVPEGMGASTIIEMVDLSIRFAAMDHYSVRSPIDSE